MTIHKAVHPRKDIDRPYEQEKQEEKRQRGGFYKDH